MLTLIVGVAAAALVLWFLVGSRRRCQACGARLQPAEAPLDRTPICWRCW